MSPRSASESALRPVPSREKLRTGWLASPQLTAVAGVAVALGLGAWGWAGHARLSESAGTASLLPPASETLDVIEQAAYEEAEDAPPGLQRVEYLSPEEIPIPPDEGPVGATYLEAVEEVPSETESAEPARETVSSGAIPEPAPSDAPSASSPPVDAVEPAPEEPVVPTPEATPPPEPAVPAETPATAIPPSDAIPTEESLPAADEALPAAESIPDLPAESPLREVATGEGPSKNDAVELQRVAPVPPEKPAPPVSDADLCRKYAPKNIGQLRLSVAPVKAGVLPADKSDPSAACFPQGAEYAGSDSWYETSCYGKYLFICHDPLYFEDQVAERYGEHWGKWVQPAVSAGKFFGGVPIAPYRFFANTLSEECYGQDKYGQSRNGFADGTFIPPFHAGAAALTAGAVTGLYFLVP